MSKNEQRNNKDRRIKQHGLNEKWNSVERRKGPRRQKKDWDKSLRVEELSRDNHVDKQFLKQLRRKQKERKLKESRKKGRLKKDIRNL